MKTSFLQSGGLWVLGQGVLMVAVVVLGTVFLGQTRWPGSTILGGLLMALGAFFGLAGSIALNKQLSPFPKPRPNAQLVQTGIYSLCRHPLYTSIMLLALGWAAFRESWPSLLAAAALIGFFNAKAVREERWLREAFPEYRSYARRVRRFLPWIY